ncbi:Bardet-Biedl syndrome 4 protein homolog, partial [Sitophilus oryzae]|uniref:Bardet-Biedl syndrome 4 protein homolog n=1 Tax=Sitophilus oryzae TaxID=7048 RepID=A0A6J2XUY1_SITOR
MSTFRYVYCWLLRNQKFEYKLLKTCTNIFFLILKSMLLNGKGLPSANRMDKPAKDNILDCSEPPPMEKLNWLMHLQHIRGEIDFCKKIINLELARSDGKNEYAFFKQGSILKEEGHIQEALEIFQKCLKLNPDNAIILREMAKCLYDMRRFRLALNAYLEAESLLKNPDWKLCYFIAQCYLKLGNIEKAKEYAHKSVKMGKQEESYGLLMKILVSERDLKSAIAVSNAATECCPDSVNMLTESGLLYLKAGQSQYAFERLSQALALEPSHSKALLGIGCITMVNKYYL